MTIIATAHVPGSNRLDQSDTDVLPKVPAAPAPRDLLDDEHTADWLQGYRIGQEQAARDRDNAWWAGYAQALRDFPNGVADAIQANRRTVAELSARIEAGPFAPGRPDLHVIAGGAA